jgi:magnesium transporter
MAEPADASDAAVAPFVQRLLEKRPDIAGSVIESYRADDVVPLITGLAPTVAASLLFAVNPDLASATIKQLPRADAGKIIAAADPVDAATLLERMAEETRDEILVTLPVELRQELRSIAEFPANAAGRLMEARVTRFSQQTRISVVLANLRKLRTRRVTDIVVTDGEGRFAGVVLLQDLLRAEPEDVLGEFLSRNAISLHPMATREEVVELFEKHKLLSVPVVDSAGRVLGVIRQQGVVEAAQETLAQDAQQMFGASAEESALSHPLFAVKSRLPWLNINLLTAFAAAAVVGIFEGTLARFTALAVLLPVVAGQSGNTGAQALAVTMRSLALREVRPRQMFRVMRKEILVGALNGLSIALVTSAGTYVWSRSFGLSLIMFLAMVASMIVAGMAGGLIPMILAKMGRDPAVASSIILTTVTDIVGFFTFLGLATVLSHLLTDLRH